VPAVRLSRYEYAPVEQDECGRLFLDVPDPIARTSRLDDARILTGEGDTIFALAWRAYESTLDREQDIRPTGFYWVIAQMNDFVDLDQVLSIPNASRVRVPSVQTLVGDILVPPRFFESDKLIVATSVV